MINISLQVVYVCPTESKTHLDFHGYTHYLTYFDLINSHEYASPVLKAFIIF